MFIFGVLIPAAITVIIFVGFLICWYKFNTNRRLFKKKRKQKTKSEFSALAISSTQGIIQYGQDEEELDNEKNTEFDRMNVHFFDERRRGPSINVVSPSISNMPKYSNIQSCTKYHCTGNTYTVEPSEAAKSQYQSKVLPALSSKSQGVVNQSLCLSPCAEGNGSENCQSVDFLFQHTFHFGNSVNSDEGPNVDQIQSDTENNLSSDSEEDVEDKGHSHFLSILEEEFKRDSY